MCRNIQLHIQFFIEVGLIRNRNLICQTELKRTVIKKDKRKGMAHLWLRSATSRWERGSISIKLFLSSVGAIEEEEECSIRFHWFEEGILLEWKMFWWDDVFSNDTSIFACDASNVTVLWELISRRRRFYLLFVVRTSLRLWKQFYVTRCNQLQRVVAIVTNQPLLVRTYHGEFGTRLYCWRFIKRWFWLSKDSFVIRFSMAGCWGDLIVAIKFSIL